MCKYEVFLCSNAGELRPIQLFSKPHHPCLTVLDLKERAVKEFPKSGPTPREVRLIVRDKPLDNDTATLCKSGITTETVVQMVRKVNGG